MSYSSIKVQRIPTEDDESSYYSEVSLNYDRDYGSGSGDDERMIKISKKKKENEEGRGKVIRKKKRRRKTKKRKRHSRKNEYFYYNRKPTSSSSSFPEDGDTEDNDDDDLAILPNSKRIKTSNSSRIGFEDKPKMKGKTFPFPKPKPRNRYFKNIVMPSTMKKKVVKEFMDYLRYVYDPHFSFVRNVAGLTNKNLDYYIMDIPYDANKYIRAYSLVNEEKIIMATYKELFEKLLRSIEQMEEDYEIIERTFIIEETMVEIVTLERNLKEEVDKGEGKDEAKIKELVEDINSKGDEAEVAISDIEKFQGDRKKKNKIVTQNKVKEMRKWIKGKKRQKDKPEEEGGTGPPPKGIKEIHKKASILHSNKIREFKEELSSTKAPYFTNLGPVMDGISSSIQNAETTVQIGVPDPSFTGTFNFSGSTGGGGQPWDVRTHDRRYFEERSQKAIYYHLKKMRDHVDRDKLSKYMKFGLPIRYKDNLTSNITYALDKVRAACGDKDDKIKIEHIIRQKDTSIRFAKLISILLKAEEFDESSRKPGGKYHAEKVYQNRYKMAEWEVIKWFSGLIFDNIQRKLVPRQLYATTTVNQTDFSNASVSSILGLRVF